MSKSQMFKSVVSVLGGVFIAVILCCESARAAKMSHGGMSFANASSSSESRSSSSRQELLIDLSAHYLRDTQPDGSTHTAGRLSVGGMFTSWIGLDVQGLYAVKSKDYLIGTDVRLVPVDWLFFKGGVGGYADKVSHSLRLTPLAGAGIMGRFGQDFYFVTEASYFQVNVRNNISFGVGLGVIL